VADGGSFTSWAAEWLELARYGGPQLSNPTPRIEELVKLWSEPVPEPWRRPIDPQLLGGRYRRRDIVAPHPGEHQLEYEVLSDPGCTKILGGTLIDGVNAVPLARDPGGGRQGNVEADLCLLVAGAPPAHRLILCEVKVDSGNAWYAAVELVRQMKLLALSSVAQNLFHDRKAIGSSIQPSPAGLVLAPSAFYEATGQKANAVPHARRLLRRLREAHCVDADLAVWNRDTREIRALETPAAGFTDPEPG
jgi:hypothetical protein